MDVSRAISTALPKIERLEFIGAGNFAHVYRCRKRFDHHGPEFAVKVIDLDTSRDPCEVAVRANEYMLVTSTVNPCISDSLIRYNDRNFLLIFFHINYPTYYLINSSLIRFLSLCYYYYYFLKITQQEVIVMRMSFHDNITKLFSATLRGKKLSMMMELASAGSVSELIKIKGSVSEPIAAIILRGTLQVICLGNTELTENKLVSHKYF